MRGLALALLLTSVASIGAAGQSDDPVVLLRGRIDAVEKQIDSDIAAAAEALDRLASDSIELRKTRSLSAVERELHSRLFVLRARAHIQLLDNATAEESMLELLRVDPRFEAALAPREQQLLETVRRRAGGVLEVGSRELGARVLVDGVEVGVTADVPVSVPLVAGTYEVRLEKTGYKPAVSRVAVAAGMTMSVTELAPERNVPPLVFFTDRDGVEVIADNVALGRTLGMAALRKQVSPAESAALDRALAVSGLDPQSAAGIIMRQPPVDRSMTIRFHRPCFIDEARTVAVTTEALGQLDPEQPIMSLGEPSVLRLRPDVGTLRVSSTPADADVFLDGQLAGRTPFDREVCSGARRVRVRHRIGSYDVAVTITRGRTEGIDVALKPDLAFLGALDASTGTAAPSPELTALIDRALASTVTAFHLAARVDLPPEVTRWSDASHAELVAAAGRNDSETVARLLKQASSNYDAPLLLSAVRSRAASDAPPAVDLLLFWSDHGAVDRVRVPDVSDKAVAAALRPFNEPASGPALVYRTVLGLRVADTGLPDAPLIVAAVQEGSPAATAGIRTGDTIETVERARATAAQFAEAIRQRQPGDIVTLRVKSPVAAARDVPIPVQRRPFPGAAFDATVPGNALIAKLTAGTHTAVGADRDLLSFSLALTLMRLGEWRRALALLEPLGNLPVGEGVGPGAVLFYRARCFEQLGDRDRAAALYKEAASRVAETLAEDGSTVAEMARLRLALLTR